MAIKKDTLDELLSGRDPKAGGPRISPIIRSRRSNVLTAECADGGRGESIAGTANRLDQARVARIRCGLLAQPHHPCRHPGRNQPISDL